MKLLFRTPIGKIVFLDDEQLHFMAMKMRIGYKQSGIKAIAFTNDSVVGEDVANYNSQSFRKWENWVGFTSGDLCDGFRDIKEFANGVFFAFVAESIREKWPTDDEEE